MANLLIVFLFTLKSILLLMIEYMVILSLGDTPPRYSSVGSQFHWCNMDGREDGKKSWTSSLHAAPREKKSPSCLQKNYGVCNLEKEREHAERPGMRLLKNQSISSSAPNQAVQPQARRPPLWALGSSGLGKREGSAREKASRISLSSK